MRPVSFFSHRRALLTSLCLGSIGPAGAQDAAPPPAPAVLAHTDLVLLQPEALLRERTGSTEALARYVQALQQAAVRALEAQFGRRPTGAFLVLAVKPGRRSRAWLDLDSPWPEPLQQTLRRALEAVPPPEVQGGPIVFAIKGSLWGGRVPTRAAPAPQAWRDEARRHEGKLDVAELVLAVWPD